MAGIFTAAVADRYLASTPCVNTAPRKVRSKEVVPPTVEEVEALLAVAGPRYRAMVAVGAGCRLRIGETLGLREPRVNFLQRTLSVRQQLVHVSPDKPVLSPLKTDASRRDVPLATMVAEALAEHLSTFPITGSDLVFRSRADTPIYPGTFRDSVWKRRLREADLPSTMRFHDLRHFTASALIHGGQSIKTVQAVLGTARRPRPSTSMATSGRTPRTTPGPRWTAPSPTPGPPCD